MKNKYFCAFIVIQMLVMVYSCDTKKRPNAASTNPCLLPQVEKCRESCEIVVANQTVAIKDQGPTSQYNYVGCSYQFSSVLSCFIKQQGENACATLDSIIVNAAYAVVLQDPKCKCSALGV